MTAPTRDDSRVRRASAVPLVAALVSALASCATPSGAQTSEEIGYGLAEGCAVTRPGTMHVSPGQIRLPDDRVVEAKVVAHVDGPEETFVGAAAGLGGIEAGAITQLDDEDEVELLPLPAELEGPGVWPLVIEVRVDEPATITLEPGFGDPFVFEVVADKADC